MKSVEKIDRILSNIHNRNSMIVALSGGVDSSVVAALAYRALAERALAVTINSPLTTSEDLRCASSVAKYIGINHMVVELNELEIMGFQNNPPERCYLCKSYRFEKLRNLANERGFRYIADGTTIDDLGEHRPGLKAGRELGVYSPLIEAEMKKEDVLIAAECLGLPITDRSHNSCLATRVPYGSELTIPRLKRIDEAEQYLHSLIKPMDLRVRDHGQIIRLELDKAGLACVMDDSNSTQVVNKLKELGFKYITVDLELYRFGSFDK